MTTYPTGAGTTRHRAGLTTGQTPQWRAAFPRDVAVALALAAAAALPGSAENGVRLGGLDLRPVDALAVALVAAQVVPLALRRVLAKLGLRDRVQAVIFAYDVGLAFPQPPDRRPG